MYAFYDDIVLKNWLFSHSILNLNKESRKVNNILWVYVHNYSKLWLLIICILGILCLLLVLQNLSFYRHLACEEDRESTALLLVKAGADLDIQNKEKKSPLAMCSSKLKNELINLKNML